MYDDKPDIDERTAKDGTEQKGVELEITDLAKALVLEFRTSGGELDLPASFTKFVELTGGDATQTSFDVFIIEAQHTVEGYNRMMFFEDDALTLLADLLGWMAYRHDDGKCNCEDESC